MSKDLVLSKFKPTHLIAICDHMLNMEQYDRLYQFLGLIPNVCITEDFIEHYQYILAILYSISCDYKSVFKVIQNFTFSPKYHNKMQKLWYDCHYNESSASKGRSLNAVEKYRIRKKFVPPPTISTGEKTTYNVLESVSQKLCNVFDQNNYPNIQQKQFLMRDTNLTLDQINNWFKNKRQRSKRLSKSSA